MILIANPIYDVVFKYLLEDKEIAMGLLSVILGEEIIDITVSPQEAIRPNEPDEDPKPLSFYRIDFAATIRNKDGSERKALIELQKSKVESNARRFRKYLGDQYTRFEIEKLPDGNVERYSLPIVTIYFLGYNLDNVKAPVLKVSRQYHDANTGEAEPTAAKDEFVNLLNHDSYFIQIRKLSEMLQTQLKDILTVFNQRLIINDHRILEYEGGIDDPLLHKMVMRLKKAAMDSELRKQMEKEEDIEDDFRHLNKKITEQEKEIEQKNEALDEKDKEIAQMRLLIEQMRKNDK